jgi:hypothetical protein
MCVADQRDNGRLAATAVQEHQGCNHQAKRQRSDCRIHDKMLEVVTVVMVVMVVMFARRMITMVPFMLPVVTVMVSSCVMRMVLRVPLMMPVVTVVAVLGCIIELFYDRLRASLGHVRSIGNNSTIFLGNMRLELGIDVSTFCRQLGGMGDEALM